jgi:hypothetical protein
VKGALGVCSAALALTGLAFMPVARAAAGEESLSGSVRGNVDSTRTKVSKRVAKKKSAVQRSAMARKKTMESEQEPGKVAPQETFRVTERRVAEVAPPAPLLTETVGIKPQLGALFYQNQGGGDEVRGLLGVTVDWNLSNTFRPDYSHWFVGLSSGALASRVGESGANFVGSGDRSQGNSLLIIPANLKIGYAFTDKLRASVRGGGNLFYRSALRSVSLGDGDSSPGASNWRMFPNAGADVEFTLGQRTVLMFRPDVTFGTADNVYSASMALSIPLG